MTKEVFIWDRGFWFTVFTFMNFTEKLKCFLQFEKTRERQNSFYCQALIPKFCTHRFLSPIVGNVGIFETIEGVEELFDQTSEIAEIQESMGVCRIRRMVGWNCVKRERENQHETQCSSKGGSIWILHVDSQKCLNSTK